LIADRCIDVMKYISKQVIVIHGVMFVDTVHSV
jgi:hypothetical protein